MVTISERPAEAADRAVPSHWESDLIIGEKGRSQILTLVERTTRFVILHKIPYDRCADRVALLLSEAAQRLPQHVWRSITTDCCVSTSRKEPTCHTTHKPSWTGSLTG